MDHEGTLAWVPLVSNHFHAGDLFGGSAGIQRVGWHKLQQGRQRRLYKSIYLVSE